MTDKPGSSPESWTAHHPNHPEHVPLYAAKASFEGAQRQIDLLNAFIKNKGLSNLPADIQSQVKERRTRFSDLTKIFHEIQSMANPTTNDFETACQDFSVSIVTLTGLINDIT